MSDEKTKSSVQLMATFVPARSARPASSSEPSPYFTVLPQIFYVRLWFSEPQEQPDDSAMRGPEGALLAAIGAAQGIVYRAGNPTFFGFPGVETMDGLKRARLVRRGCEQAAPPTAVVALSCSTVGRKSHAEMLSKPWAFVGSDALFEAMGSHVLYYRMEPI